MARGRVGHQLRYLVGSAHGWLGGVGFAACACRRAMPGLAGTTRGAATNCTGWWDTDPPRGGLPQLGFARPGSGGAGSGHGLRAPLRLSALALETFVDEREHTGASWRAANWVRVGETAGHGRQDRTHATAKTRKAVYMYELETAWRERLAVPAPGVVPLALGDGLDAESWAAHEFGGAALGDARLSARLVASARHLAQHPAMPRKEHAHW